MRITQEMKLKMVEEHLLKGKSLSHISQAYDNYDVSNIKYNVNLYKKFGSEVFLNREDKIYYRDTKLLAIKRVLEGNESIRSVALDFGLTDPTILLSRQVGVPKLVVFLNKADMVDDEEL